jgi:hypothetical protein
MPVEIRLSFNVPPQSSFRELRSYLERPDSGLEVRPDREQYPIGELPSEVDIAIQLAALVLSAPAAAQAIIELIGRLRKKEPGASVKPSPNPPEPSEHIEGKAPSVILVVNNVKYQIGNLNAETIERLLDE